MLRASSLIAAKTSETRDLLPRQLQSKCIINLGMGLYADQIAEPRDQPNRPPRLLFAGRLLYWKGLHLALSAFQRIRQASPGARFTIVGQGPEEMKLRRMADRLGIADAIMFIPWLKQSDLFSFYHAHDLFFFPSLHDSGGNVVLESLCRALPVVCLDLGAPGLIVNDTCGAAVRTGGFDSEGVARALADAVLRILAEPDGWRHLSSGATERARQFLWSTQVAQFYSTVEARLS
jgi:glycosyltransferase involved in cell wall biosynthesis